MRYRKTAPGVCAVLVCLGLSAAPYGHEGATGIVKERMDAMSDIADANKAIGAMLRGKRAMDRPALSRLAGTIVEHAETMTALFPDTAASRSGHKTEALPAIWERWDAFRDYAEALRAESAALSRMAAGPEEALRAQHRKVAQTCKGCHGDFRQKKR